MNTVIDCGSGPGGTAVKLAKSFKNVEAFDLSEGFVKLAEEELRN